MSGVVEAIYVAGQHGAPQLAVAEARLSPDAGLVGDRHAGPDAVITLIEAEAIERFREQTGLTVADSDIGRNVVTRGISLNPLVGQTFHLGDARLEGMELCEPCAMLGARLETADVPAAEVVRTFVASAGIRAYVRSDGAVAPGTAVG